MDIENKGKPFYCDSLISESSIPDEFALVSKNGTYAAKIQMDGNFVVYKYPENKALWNSKTCGKGAAPYCLKMQNDGNIVIYDGRNIATWSSGTVGRGEPPYKLIMSDDGNLVMKDSKDLIYWGSWTKQN